MKSSFILLKKYIASFISIIIFIFMLKVCYNVDVYAVNSSQTYTVFNAKTGLRVSSYTLDANPFKDNSRYTVIDDKRYIDNSVIGAVKIVFTNGTMGSGFVIDEHTIGTAAHCVFNKDGGSSSNSKVSIRKILILDNHGNVIKTITNVSNTHVPSRFINLPLNNPEYSYYDYAMITVSDDLTDYMCFNLGVMMNSMVGTDLVAYCTGFPVKVNGKTVNGYDNNGNEIHTKYTDYGNIQSANDYVFYYNIDASEGDSGCPIYIKTTYNGDIYYTIIGIHTVATSLDGEIYLRGGGIRMTTNLLHFYKNNPNINY